MENICTTLVNNTRTWNRRGEPPRSPEARRCGRSSYVPPHSLTYKFKTLKFWVPKIGTKASNPPLFRVSLSPHLILWKKMERAVKSFDKSIPYLYWDLSFFPLAFSHFLSTNFGCLSKVKQFEAVAKEVLPGIHGQIWRAEGEEGNMCENARPVVGKSCPRKPGRKGVFVILNY